MAEHAPPNRLAAALVRLSEELSRIEGATVGDASESEDPNARRRGWVLVADDDPDVRDAIRTLLEQQGYSVETHEDGSSVIDAARNRPWIGAVLDWDMPAPDGLETLRALRQITEWKSCAVVFLSGRAETEAQHDALAMGAVAYFTKPFDAAMLSRQLGAIFGQ
jgi:DNA-binding response OmpR family regulator